MKCNWIYFILCTASPVAANLIQVHAVVSPSKTQTPTLPIYHLPSNKCDITKTGLFAVHISTHYSAKQSKNIFLQCHCSLPLQAMPHQCLTHLSFIAFHPTTTWTKWANHTEPEDWHVFPVATTHQFYSEKWKIAVTGGANKQKRSLFSSFMFSSLANYIPPSAHNAWMQW